jgi:hypothetical protein
VLVCGPLARISQARLQPKSTIRCLRPEALISRLDA